MERFTAEEFGKLYGHSVQLQAMIYFLGTGDWESNADATKSTLTTILGDCNGIIDIVLPKAMELMPKAEEIKADEQEKTD
jgi:hypothetical protein